MFWVGFFNVHREQDTNAFANRKVVLLHLIADIPLRPLKSRALYGFRVSLHRND